MSVEKGIAPDLVVYIDTPPSRVVEQPSVSSLFEEGVFQQAIYDLYAHPSIWTGIKVCVTARVKINGNPVRPWFNP